MKNKAMILTLGCPKNLVDSEVLASELENTGYEMTSGPREANIILVNTCGFIEEAVSESLEAILDLGQMKTEGQRLVVIGCMVGRYGESLVENLPEVDLFISPAGLGRLKEILDAGESGLAESKPKVDSTLLKGYSQRMPTTGPGWAYVKIAEGCANKCRFCTIPSIKGPLISRNPESILKEIECFAQKGIKEINLVAQDLTDYGKDVKFKYNLAYLLEQIEKIENIAWVRMHYLNPETISENLINAPAKYSKVLPYFDLPIQHVAEKVVKNMGRRKIEADIRNILNKISDTYPKFTLRATVMVGHPGEGEEEFNQLLEFLAEARFDHLGCFHYQAEEGTPSARMKQIPREIALKREEAVMAQQKEISKAKLAERVDNMESALVLGPHPESDLVWHGRLWSQAPDVDGELIITECKAEPGEIAECRIVDSFDYDLEGHIT
ncbi:30S ribosomal protein S12 methylthiotransferase RimO [Dethiosulfatarculus sandiegensis]|uniref:Ribosomal protein uS12 methylthiotransferase RimO n=1 Tax=Dethiosulfatarculus sandiegensis TaxID=1429043 RepID=A0A0D2J8P1_9BACT|nr:30S ribosomal protein S12 methylthiotransferase RimO [Dethiosulfatarculus sandiegensis]KIX14509.1 30S ribosomal protein S12 methylthiotransferase [Dethiosulfatarculus sandiegensis]